MNDENCMIHGESLDFYCKKCSDLICEICCNDFLHREHEKVSFDDVLKREEGQYDKQMERIWGALKEYSAMTDYYEEKNRVIESYYRDLHELLRVEEENCKMPLLKEKEKAENIIMSSINELKVINSLKIDINKRNRAKAGASAIESKAEEELEATAVGAKRKRNADEDESEENKTTATGDTRSSQEDDGDSEADGDGDSDMDFYFNNNYLTINTVQGYIQGSDTLESFVKKNKKTLFKLSKADREATLNSKFKEYKKSMNLDAAKKPILYDVFFDNKELNDMKNKLKTLYRLKDTTKSIKTNFFTLGSNGAFTMNLESNMWTKCATEDTKRDQAINSVVIAKNNIYIFGGHKSNATYSIFSTKGMEYTTCEPLKRCDIVQGSKCVSACYDNDKTIYLVGGRSDKGNILSIDSYDIETKEFKKLMVMDQQRHGAFSFYSNGMVYIVGGFTVGEHGNFGEFKSILKYNCANNTLDMYMNELPIIGKTVGCCFDGDDSLYMLISNGNFLRVTISSKTITSLLSPSIPKYPDTRRPLIFVPNENKLIYFIGSEKYGNHSYNLKENKWMQLVHELGSAQDINANVGISY